MTSQVVPIDSLNERQHRTSIATATNELIKLRQPNDPSDIEASVSAKPIDVRYPSGDIRRYAGDPTGVRNSRDALQAASDVSAAGGGNIIIEGGAYKISSNVTVASGATIEFRQGGSLSIDNGVTVTINGTCIAPVTQIFSGSGTANFSAQGATLYPQWWGVKTDGTDVVTAWNKAIAAAPSNVLQIPSGTYTFASKPATISSAMKIVGELNDKSILLADYDEADPDTGFLHVDFGGVVIRNLRIHKAAGQTGGSGIAIKATASAANSFTTVDSVIVTGLSGTGTWDFALFVDGTAKTSAPIGVRDLEILNSCFFAATNEVAAFYGVQNARIDAAFFPAGGTAVAMRVSGTSSVPSNFVNITSRFLDTFVLDFCSDVTMVADTQITISDTSNASNVIIVTPRIVSDTRNRTNPRVIAANLTDRIAGVVVTASPSGTIASGQVGISATTSTTVGAAGTAAAPPASPQLYWTINVAGTNYKVPLYLS